MQKTIGILNNDFLKILNIKNKIKRQLLLQFALTGDLDIIFILRRL